MSKVDQNAEVFQEQAARRVTIETYNVAAPLALDGESLSPLPLPVSVVVDLSSFVASAEGRC